MIGVFDSGLGGLSVLAALIEALPRADFVYFADSAHVPYGDKSETYIQARVLAIGAELIQSGCTLLVVACNTATATALPELREHFAPLPVLGVVRPGAEAAVAASRNKRIVVIATEATIAGGAYQQAIASLCPEARVQGRACTLFVPLAEEGWMDGPIVEGIASRYLGDLFSPGRPDRPDTLVLGCTHFPLFREALRHVVGDDVRIVDSAETAAVAVENRLRELGLLRGEDAPGSHRFMTTDNVLRFIRTGSLFLGHPLKSAEVSLVDLS